MNIATEQIFLPNSSGAEGSMGLHKPASTTPLVNLENVEDFSNVCRVCAAVTELVMPIFSGEGLQNNLADKIHKHLQITVTERDSPSLPIVACYQCVSTLLATHELVQCSIQADAALRTRSAVLAARRIAQEEKLLKNDGNESEETDRWKRQSSVASDGDISQPPDDAPWDPGHDDDDRPLSTLATKKTDAYETFYAALLNFRNHFLNEHESPARAYPEFTDTSDGESSLGGESVEGKRDVDEFDDLTRRNMRRDRLDEPTRLAIARARTLVDGKILYACSQCGKRLSSAHTLLLHARIHTGERPCVCHVCGAQFRAPGGLRRHLAETHERRRRRACRLCQRTFANSQNLKQHLRTHTGERPYSCTLCGKRFAQAGSLHAHRRTHSPARPHRCAHCPAAFRLRAGLVRHRRGHSGERPHACACGRAFRTRAELLAHRAAHQPTRAHSCAICAAAFRSRRALKHHARRLHPEPPPQPPPPAIATNPPTDRSYFVLAPL